MEWGWGIKRNDLTITDGGHLESWTGSKLSGCFLCSIELDYFTAGVSEVSSQNFVLPMAIPRSVKITLFCALICHLHFENIEKLEITARIR